REARLVRAGDDFDATGFLGRVVERGPDLQRGVLAQPPEASAVLVPGQLGSAPGRLGEEHRAIEDDAAFDARSRDLFEERALDQRPEEGILLELFDLPVLERRSLPADAARQVVVAAGA